jgi:alanine racemase
MIPESIGTRPVWAEVSLDHLAHNIRETKRITPSSTMLMAAVKADGYGHGVEMCARTFLDNGADRLAVAIPDEGFQLREMGIDAPILCLGYTPGYLYERAIDEEVSVTIYHESQVQGLVEAARAAGKEAVFHAKIDTGMGRLGFQPSKESIDVIVKTAQTDGLYLEGIFTHFAVSDEADKGYSHGQYERYMNTVDSIEEHVEVPIKHVNNSAGIIDLPEYSLDMARPGIILYGYYPSPHVDTGRLELRQAMTLKARISHMKWVPKGTGLSYGLTYETEKESVIATIPVGYADGYKRALTNKGYVGIGGVKASIVGRVCMDQCMLDVTHIKDARIGDEVTLMGMPGGVAPDGEEMAKLLDTITHEVTCQITRRVPRVYTRNGKKIAVKNYLT